MAKKYPVSDGRVNIPVVAQKGYSTKQNSRSTTRSVRGKRSASSDFKSGAEFGKGGSDQSHLVINAS